MHRPPATRLRGCGLGGSVDRGARFPPGVSPRPASQPGHRPVPPARARRPQVPPALRPSRSPLLPAEEHGDRSTGMPPDSWGPPRPCDPGWWTGVRTRCGRSSRNGAVRRRCPCTAASGGCAWPNGPRPAAGSAVTRSSDGSKRPARPGRRRAGRGVSRPLMFATAAVRDAPDQRDVPAEAHAGTGVHLYVVPGVPAPVSRPPVRSRLRPQGPHGTSPADPPRPESRGGHPGRAARTRAGHAARHLTGTRTPVPGRSGRRPHHHALPGTRPGDARPPGPAGGRHPHGPPQGRLTPAARAPAAPAARGGTGPLPRTGRLSVLQQGGAPHR